MYFWKVDSLVEDFKAGNVSQKEEFKYMLLSTVLMTVIMDPALYVGHSYNIYDTVGTIMMLGGAIFGVNYCYKVNSSGDNKDFIVRMMCIGLPVLVRVLAVMIPLIIIGGALETAFLYPESLDEETFENTPVQVFLTSIFLLVYYWYLSKKIRVVSSFGNS